MTGTNEDSDTEETDFDIYIVIFSLNARKHI